MSVSSELREAILEKLATVIDPETGVDVVRMRLIEDLEVQEMQVVGYIQAEELTTLLGEMFEEEREL